MNYEESIKAMKVSAERLAAFVGGLSLTCGEKIEWQLFMAKASAFQPWDFELGANVLLHSSGDAPAGQLGITAYNTKTGVKLLEV